MRLMLACVFIVAISCLKHKQQTGLNTCKILVDAALADITSRKK